MAIDGIGGSDPDTIALRRRAIEEQKARELDRIEKRYKKQVEETQKNRSKAIEQIYESTEGEVEASRDDAEFKVQRAKQAADERVRAFQQDTLRMTDEARRQFESKAKALDQAAMQMDEQRRYLAKQHSESMAHIQKEREERYNDLTSKHAREALRIDNEYKRRSMSAQDRHASELAQKQREFQHEKAKVQTDGVRQLEFLKHERDLQRASIESEVEQARKQGSAQLQEQRINHATQKTLLEGEQSSSIDDQNRRYNLEMNRTSMRGKRMLDEMRERQIMEAFQNEKEHKNKIRNAQTQAAIKLTTVENEGKLREHIAKQAFDHQLRTMEQNTQTTLTDRKKQADTLRDQAQGNLETQSKMLKNRSEKILGDQAKQYAKDIEFNRKLGQRQLDATVLANAEKVAKYSSKANDPFYRVHNLGTTLSEDEKFVTLKVPSTEHEQSQVRVTHRPGQVTISTTRRFEGKAESEDGRRQVTTNSYQSYSESLPVEGALDMRNLSKTYDGTHVVFKIPKV